MRRRVPLERPMRRWQRQSYYGWTALYRGAGIEVTTTRIGRCMQCGRDIPAATRAIYVPGGGVGHIECLRRRAA